MKRATFTADEIGQMLAREAMRRTGFVGDQVFVTTEWHMESDPDCNRIEVLLFDSREDRETHLDGWKG